MKKERFAAVMGNIDEEMIAEANIPSAPKQRQYMKWRRAASFAAIFMLMLCCFGAGAFSFAREKAEPQIEISEIGLTLLLPEEWQGHCAIEQINKTSYCVYSTEIRAAFSQTWETENSGGALFYISLWEQQLTKEQVDAGGEWDYAPCQYIMTTKDGTYLLHRASDVQFTEETQDQYRQMEKEISRIRFVIHEAL